MKRLQTFFTDLKEKNSPMVGRALLNKEEKNLSASWLIACYGNRDADENFDWLSSCLPYASANETVINFPDSLIRNFNVPVLAGLCAQDPFMDKRQLLKTVRDKGYSGVCNLPSVGIMDGSFRNIFEKNDLGLKTEIDLLSRACELDIFTMALVFSVDEAKLMLEAGASSLLVHPGLAYLDDPAVLNGPYLNTLHGITRITGLSAPVFACCININNILETYNLFNIDGYFEPLNAIRIDINPKETPL